MSTQSNYKLLLSAILLFIINGQIYSQTATSTATVPKMRFGFKTGLNFNWNKVKEGPVANSGTKIGYTFGLMGDFNLGGNAAYWLNIEGLVTSFNSNYKSTDTFIIKTNNFSQVYNTANFNYKNQYLQIPISLKLKTNEIGRFTYWGQLGIAPSILISTKVSTVATPTIYASGTSSHSPNASANDKFDFNGGNDANYAFKDDINVVRASMIVGAGIETKLSGKTYVSAGLRFDNGLGVISMLKDKRTKSVNNYLGLHVGLYF